MEAEERVVGSEENRKNMENLDESSVPTGDNNSGASPPVEPLEADNVQTGINDESTPMEVDEITDPIAETRENIDDTTNIDSNAASESEQPTAIETVDVSESLDDGDSKDIVESVDAIATDSADAIATDSIDAIATDSADAIATDSIEAIATDSAEAIATDSIDAIATESVDITPNEFQDTGESLEATGSTGGLETVDPMDTTESVDEQGTSKLKEKISDQIDVTSQEKSIGKEAVSTEQNTTEAEEDVVLISDGKKDNEKKDSEVILPDSSENAVTINDSDETHTQKDSGDEKYIISSSSEDTQRTCMQCKLDNLTPKYNVNYKNELFYLCSEYCFNNFKEENPNNFVKRELRVKVFASQERTATFSTVPSIDFIRRCHECARLIKDTDISLGWEALEFCTENCLLKYQKSIGANCYTCHTDVPESILGKYCVRFGTSLKQFCSTVCLEKSKRELKVCPYCQEDLSASTKVVENYCGPQCLMKAKNLKPDKKKEECSVCHQEKDVEIEYNHEDKINFFCGDPCFVAYKFVNNVVPVQCEMCGQYVKKDLLNQHSVHYNGVHNLCSKKCQSIYIVSNRKIVLCFWCKVKKYNFDMVEQRGQNGHEISMCSINCLKIFQASIKAVNSKKHNCDNCKKYLKAMYHLSMSDSTSRHFCCYLCLLTYQSTQPPPLFTSAKKTVAKEAPIIQMPVISHVQSLANPSSNQLNGNATTEEIEKKIRQLVFVKPPPIPMQRNMATMVRPNMVSKSVGFKVKEDTKGTQTDIPEKKVIVPIPVPIFVPTPMHMYTQYVPFPVPFVLPIPVPIFIPTTRNSAKGILKEINKIKTKVPADPLEAELLMMAELVAEDKKAPSDSSSEDEVDNTVASVELPKTEETRFNEPVETPNLTEDVLQMALKMASDFEEPVDLEGAVSASTITVQSSAQTDSTPSYTPSKRRPGRPSKGSRKSPRGAVEQHVQVVPPMPAEKPDANMCLKYTFGVNAWKQWVTTKNAELEKSSSRRVKLFKTEILQLTADELNFSLCLFVKEVRKPNGKEYAPDTIYYLCLGIQQYLYENGRIDNIFCDAFYEKFTDCLNEVCRKFSALYNDSQYIVTRVEEEHLWESKQLGAHSPLVLINTLMFFNTKHFCLTTVDEHLQLSFSHIMKHWKRNPNQPGARNVLLRFYPPQSAMETRKKKMYEQQENEENPLRCPVKLYEFYLSKCPESVKTRNDVFYLLPERSCVPDSPLWYSTMALDKETLEKMLNRVKMVKEINVALLTS